MRISIHSQSGVALWVILAGIAVFTTVGLVMTRAIADFDRGAFQEQSAKALAAAVVADSAAIISQIKAIQGDDTRAGPPDLSEDSARGVFAYGRLSAEQKQPPFKAIAPGAGAQPISLANLRCQGSTPLA